MTKVVPIVPGSSDGGNTITPSIKESMKKQIAPSKRWLLVLNNYTKSEYDMLLDICSSNSSKIDKFIIGQEVGECGTPHLQGYIEFKCKIRPLSVIPTDRIHWEKCKGDRESNITYCSKDGKYVTNFHIPKPIKVLEESAFFPWQKWLLDKLMTEPDDRTVIWIWEETGCIGKSAFAKYMCYKHNCTCVDGKAADIFNGISNYKLDKGFFPEIIIVDCPRHNLEYMNYGAIEKVKNGLIFNAKYESKQLLFNSPHVVVFANAPPDRTKFSADRWIVKKIKNKLDLII